jgi:N-acetylglucosaminyl-diphospho-decaprenol L-rhamnosyltransferase
MISISIVSHGQFELIKNLLDDLEKYCENTIEVLLTINISEDLPENFSYYHFPIILIKNSKPRGFGANHNTAFQKSTQPYFCVLNPDIRLTENPYPQLIEKLNNKNIGIVAPVIIDEKSQLQDSARKFLNFSGLFQRIFYKKISQNNAINPDWVAGMFMLFRKEIYAEINGFDEGYYLYCEDMDICMRLREKSYQVYYDSAVKVIHLAQRHSHQNIRYFIWHIRSLLRYFWKYYFR